VRKKVNLNLDGGANWLNPHLAISHILLQLVPPSSLAL
jgi:hypothetical protein